MNKKNKNLKTKNPTSHIPPHTSKSGITLIALVITIIVMLILTAVTVTMAINGGLFNYAGKAGRETRFAVLEEQLYSAYMEEIMKDYANGTNTASFGAAISKVNANNEYNIEPITTGGVTDITLSTSSVIIGTENDKKTQTITVTPQTTPGGTSYYVVEGGQYYKINYNENGQVKIDKDPSEVDTSGSGSGGGGSGLSIAFEDTTIAGATIEGNTITITGLNKAGETNFTVTYGTNIEKEGRVVAASGILERTLDGAMWLRFKPYSRNSNNECNYIRFKCSPSFKTIFRNSK